MSVYPENRFLSPPLTLTLSPLGGERGLSSGTIFIDLMVPPFCGGMGVYPENRFLSPPPHPDPLPPQSGGRGDLLASLFSYP